MSTITKEFTKEQLQQIIETDHVQCGEASSLARIALASLEAEPVAWLLSGGGAKNNVSFDSGNAYADPLREVTPLYTAPPAPVALTSGYSDFEEIWSSSTHPLTQDDEMKDFAWDIWNACRAAMLQSFGNSEQLEPVTTANKLPECWVACSERMPDDEEDVLCFGQYGDNDIDEERYQFMGWLSSKGIKRVWRVSDGDSQNRRARVTHWMPLPAAPQREGENV